MRYMEDMDASARTQCSTGYEPKSGKKLAAIDYSREREAVIPVLPDREYSTRRIKPLVESELRETSEARAASSFRGEDSSSPVRAKTRVGHRSSKHNSTRSVCL